MKIVVVLLSFATVFPLSLNPPEVPYMPSRSATQNSELLTHSAQYYITVPIDHFGDPSDTFQLRYLIKDNYFTRGTTNPVFLYVGGAGSVTEAYGRWDWITTDLAQEKSALIVFAQHRYFGESMPYSTEQQTYSTQGIQYLTPQQALLDLTKVVQYIRSRYNADSSPIYAFGSGYSGLLAFWLRQKYPNYVVGVIASSAPVKAFAGDNTNAVITKVSSVFQSVNDQCRSLVRTAFDTLNSHRRRSDSYIDMSDSMGLCSVLESEADTYLLIQEMERAFQHIATFNYPIETDPLPANPVTQFCNSLLAQNITNPGWWGGFTGSISSIFGHLTDRQKSILAAVREATFSVFGSYDLVTTNSDGSQCIEHRVKSSQNKRSALAWDYLQCSSLIIPISNTISSSLFIRSTWSQSTHISQCESRWPLVFSKPTWAFELYGGANPKRQFGTFSNVLFVNSNQDPWFSSCITTVVKDGKVDRVTSEGAFQSQQYLPPQSTDSVSLKNTRIQIKAFLTQWQSEWEALLS